MIRQIEPTKFNSRDEGSPVIDVRSPGEFAQGHIPGAYNIPLFDDAERARVGTLYSKTGAGSAILKGLEIALPKISLFQKNLKSITGDKQILLHCWRGGMRSASMAELFNKAGFDVEILTGGYKAWRRFVREELAKPAQILVVGGATGSGKTELLHSLALKWEQVIDLERLACHKGSVFGAFGQKSQPTNEQFENDLFAEWNRLDRNKPVWIEDESRMIGKITLPDPVVEKISKGTFFYLDVGKTERIARLVKEYADFDKRTLSGAILQIRDRLGGTRVNDALAALENGRFEIVTDIVLSYYDKAYQFAIQRRQNKSSHTIRLLSVDYQDKATEMIQFASKYL